MDVPATGNEMTEARRVRDVVDHFPLPPLVSGYEVRVGETWDGDPAVWVYLQTPMWDRHTDEEARGLFDMIMGLSNAVERSIPSRSAFVQMIAAPGLN